ncbi:MAG: hypothetical protein H8E55_72190 [Pelagibacterales bacterium]|nr:hypothetical protein [Pelagibacterales bacterium]
MKWTKKRVIKDAKKYKHKVTWHKESNGAYKASKRLKIYSEATKHMTFPPRPKTKEPYKWNLKTLKEVALKYSSLNEFIKNEESAYVMALRKKWLNKIDSHMIRLSRKNYWDKEKVKESALKFEHKSSWSRNDPTAYHLAHKNGWIDELTKHMSPLGTRFKRCIYSIQIKGQKKIYIGLTYNYKRRIKNHLVSKRFVLLAKKYGKQNIQDNQLTNYLPVEEAILKEGEFVDKYKKKGYEILNLVKTGIIGGSNRIWTEAKILEEAKKYKTRSEWEKKNHSSRKAAILLNIYDEATKHMTWGLRWRKK